MNTRLFISGLVIWAGATIALRFGGQYLLRPDARLGMALLFLVSFPAMAWVVRSLCSGARLPREQWPAGAVAIALPTLLLDPFSTIFFPVVFPNMAPEMARVFGGWMLWCCAGALVGGVLQRSRAVAKAAV